MNTSRGYLVIGGLVLAEAALLFVPVAILGAAINWPESLDFAPSQALPLIDGQLGQVRLGYGIYLVYSLAWVLIGPAIAWLALGRDKQVGPLFVVAVGLICAWALARAIGIIRWLTASTFLAETYAAATPEMRQTIDLIQSSVNAWGGAIGEILGVSLFTVGWLVVVSLIILRNGGLPRILGWSGLFVAPILASPVIELFGMEASIFISTLSIHLWLFAAGFMMVGMALFGKEA
ncbi:DUF4386 family protein [Roseisalinus antarcticus]|uniref:DUF4386 domain-containing protein n=1 Tax=Roseisalinus antarcticus TaxID=254357 RepID=A0A1Y5TE63_9RHOB|nr:DUF4386 family protein [Roseisalinus antarcticus]SLN61654.1 hypothetical protein ROA7023_02877 [Roseisalinus antarcticus]